MSAAPGKKSKKDKKAKRPKSLMPMLPADAFRCYVSPYNDGAEFIEENLDVNNCYGVEMQVFTACDTLVIWLAPLPTEEAGPEPCNFYLRCIEKLDNPKLIEMTGDKSWVHCSSGTAYRRLVSGTMEVLGLALRFENIPTFTQKMAKEYMKRMGVKPSR